LKLNFKGLKADLKTMQFSDMIPFEIIDGSIGRGVLSKFSRLYFPLMISQR